MLAHNDPRLQRRTPSDPVLLSRDNVEGVRRHQGVRASVYGQRSFHKGTEQVPAEVALCKRIAAVLFFYYPGHAWSVEVMMDHGIAKISIPALLGFNWGYVIHLDKLDRQAVKQAGGQVLERFNIPRSSVDIAAYMDARKTVPMLGNFRSMHQKLIPGGNIRCL